MGYGFYNGYKIRSYAEEIKNIINESQNNWTFEQMDERNIDQDTIEKFRADLQIVEDDCANQLNKINSLKAPSKAHNLQLKTKEYFTIGRQISADVGNLFDQYIEIIKKQMAGETNVLLPDTSDEKLQQIASEENKNKLKNYPEEIKTEIDKLTKIIFSF